MYYDRIFTPADVKRNAQGLVSCGDSHSRGSWHYMKEEKRPAASTAWVDLYGKGNVVFVCKQHTGVVKANITKGSYSFREVVAIEDAVEKVAANPAAYIAAAKQKREDDIAAAKAAREARDLAQSREWWDEKRADYNLPAEATKVAKMGSLTDIGDDPWGRVFVSIPGLRGNLTPNEARLLAERLNALASGAQARTDEAVKP